MPDTADTRSHLLYLLLVYLGHHHEGGGLQSVRPTGGSRLFLSFTPALLCSLTSREELPGARVGSQAVKVECRKTDLNGLHFIQISTERQLGLVSVMSHLSRCSQFVTTTTNTVSVRLIPHSFSLSDWCGLLATL